MQPAAVLRALRGRRGLVGPVGGGGGGGVRGRSGGRVRAVAGPRTRRRPVHDSRGPRRGTRGVLVLRWRLDRALGIPARPPAGAAPAAAAPTAAAAGPLGGLVRLGAPSGPWRHLVVRVVAARRRERTRVRAHGAGA